MLGPTGGESRFAVISREEGVMSRWVLRWLVLLAAATISFSTTTIAQAQANVAVDIVAVGEPRLAARGAAVTVPITVTVECDGGVFQFGDVSASLSQRHGQRVVTGGGSRQLSCGTQTYNLLLRGDRPFRAGSAVLDAFASACIFFPETGDFVCDNDALTQEVTIRRG
jgi:hypothetical protein